MFTFLYEVQLAIRGSLTGAVEGFAQTGDWGVLLAMMPLGIVFGAVPGLTAVMAIALCLPLTFTMGPAAGLSLLVAQSATAFTLLKYVGAAYLVYLGVRMLVRKEAGAPEAGAASSRGARRAPAARAPRGRSLRRSRPSCAAPVRIRLPRDADGRRRGSPGSRGSGREGRRCVP